VDLFSPHKEIVASLWDWLLLETKRFTTNNWQVCQYLLQFAPQLFGKHVAIGPVLYKYAYIFPLKKQKHRQEGRRVGKDLLSCQKIQFCLRTFGWKYLRINLNNTLCSMQILNSWIPIFLFIDKFAFGDAVILPERTICKNVLIFI